MWSGVAVIGAPAVERELSLDHDAYTLVVFAAPMLAASLIEARLALLSDHVPRRRLVAVGLALLALSLIVCAMGSTAWVLSAGLALAGTASGVACGAAQAELVSRMPPERAMTRWMLAGSLGDALTPLAIAGALAMGWGHRAAFLVVAGLVAAQAAHAAVTPADAGSPGDAAAAAATDPEDAEPPPLRDALRASLGNRRLWMWLAGAATCTLLDEIVVALGTLHARIDLGTTEAIAAWAATAFAIGSTLGALVCERLVDRVPSSRVLVTSASACAAALVGAVLAPALATFLLAVGVVGFAAAPHYPLLKARAYLEVPSRPGIVNALDEVFVVVELAAPLAIGVIADRWGLRAAMAALLLQPLVVLALMGMSAGAGRRRRT